MPDDINTLLNTARCYEKCIPPGMQRSVMISILANIWAGNSAPCPDCPTCPDCTGEPYTLNPAAANPLDLIGLFTFGDLIDRNGSIYSGELILNDTVCVPGYDIENTTSLMSIRAPNLIAIDPNNSQTGSFRCIGNTGLTSLDLISLTSCAGGFYCRNNAALTTVDLSSAVSFAGAFGCYTLASLTSLSIGAAVSFGGQVYLYDNTSITAIDLHSAVSFGASIFCSGCTSLTTVNLNALSILVGNIDFSDDALIASSVNHILSKLVSATTDGSTPWAGTCSLNGGTNAAPTGQGIIDKATLNGRPGCSVTTN